MLTQPRPASWWAEEGQLSKEAASRFATLIASFNACPLSLGSLADVDNEEVEAAVRSLGVMNPPRFVQYGDVAYLELAPELDPLSRLLRRDGQDLVALVMNESRFNELYQMVTGDLWSRLWYPIKWPDGEVKTGALTSILITNLDWCLTYTWAALSLGLQIEVEFYGRFCLLFRQGFMPLGLWHNEFVFLVGV